MAQFFNFKGDYFGLTESDVQKNIDLYGYNIYTKKEQPRERFNPGKVILSPSALLMFIAGVLSFFSSGILTGIVIILIDIAWCVANIRIGQRSDERLDEFHESTVMKYRVIGKTGACRKGIHRSGGSDFSSGGRERSGRRNDTGMPRPDR